MNGSLLPLFLKAVWFDGSTAVTMKAYDFHGKRNICGDRIREARLRARLSQSDLCRRLQLAGVIVERDVISRIENGGRFVADFEVVVIADVLEVSVDWLLGKE